MELGPKTSTLTWKVEKLMVKARDADGRERALHALARSKQADTRDRAVPIEQWMSQRKKEIELSMRREDIGSDAHRLRKAWSSFMSHGRRKPAAYPDVDDLLAALLNVPQITPKGNLYVPSQVIQEFERQYPNLDLRWPVSDVAHAFRRAWEKYKKSGATVQMNWLIGGILNDPVKGRPTGIFLNIVGGWKIQPNPRDLLDLLALEFLKAHRAVSRCDQCNMLFIRTAPNEKRCDQCKPKAERHYKTKWQSEKRATARRGGKRK